MIYLKNLTKYYPSKIGKQFIFKNLNFTINLTNSTAILGSNGAGKSTLFRMIAASEYPNRGKIITDLNVSWPVALATGIHKKMTGRENTRFIGRINGVINLKQYEQKVVEFAQLGRKYDLPVSTYSSGMRARLAFACCIAIDFDVYLIDEATSVGDIKFRTKAKKALLEKKNKAKILMVSHELDELELFCQSAILIHQKKLRYFEDLKDAIKYYKKL